MPNGFFYFGMRKFLCFCQRSCFAFFYLFAKTERVKLHSILEHCHTGFSFQLFDAFRHAVQTFPNASSEIQHISGSARFTAECCLSFCWRAAPFYHIGALFFQSISAKTCDDKVLPHQNANTMPTTAETAIYTIGCFLNFLMAKNTTAKYTSFLKSKISIKLPVCRYSSM